MDMLYENNSNNTKRMSRLGTQETRVTQVRSKNRISVRYLFLINKVPKSSEDPKHKTQSPSNPKMAKTRKLSPTIQKGKNTIKVNPKVNPKLGV